mgnify:CR=1 FL=1
MNEQQQAAMKLMENQIEFTPSLESNFHLLKSF